jgi:chromosome segregation ATPase
MAIPEEKARKEVLQTVTRISNNIVKLDKEYLGLRASYTQAEDALEKSRTEYKKTVDQYDRVNEDIIKRQKQRGVVSITKVKAQEALRAKLKEKAERLRSSENRARSEYLRIKGQILKRGNSIKEYLDRLRRPLLTFRVTAMGGPARNRTLKNIKELESYIVSDLDEISKRTF